MPASDWEIRVAAKLLDWLVRFLDAVGKAVLAAFTRWGSQPDPTGVYQSTPLWTEAVDDLMDLFDDVIEAGWGEGTDIQYPGNEAFANYQLATTRNLLTRIPDEVYNSIFAAISDGINEGESNQDIAVRVQQVLSTTGSEMWPNRARVIAVTETNRSFNAGQYAGALYSEQVEGTALVKEWVAKTHGKGAERTRETHFRADGQKRRLQEPFTVGGFPLLFPGDPAGPPQEVINCRCSMAMSEA